MSDNLKDMKTLSKHRAGMNFQEVADLAHEGETIVVTNAGKPWCKVVPADHKLPRRKSAADFHTRLQRLFPKPLPASTMAEFVENR